MLHVLVTQQLSNNATVSEVGYLLSRLPLHKNVLSSRGTWLLRGRQGYFFKSGEDKRIFFLKTMKLVPIFTPGFLHSFTKC